MRHIAAKHPKLKCLCHVLVVNWNSDLEQVAPQNCILQVCGAQALWGESLLPKPLCFLLQGFSIFIDGKRYWSRNDLQTSETIEANLCMYQMNEPTNWLTNQRTKQSKNRTTKLPNNQPVNHKQHCCVSAADGVLLKILMWIQATFWKETLSSGHIVAYAIKPTLRSLFAWKLALNLSHLHFCKYNLGEGWNCTFSYWEKPLWAEPWQMMTRHSWGYFMAYLPVHACLQPPQSFKSSQFGLHGEIIDCKSSGEEGSL